MVADEAYDSWALIEMTYDHRVWAVIPPRLTVNTHANLIRLYQSLETLPDNLVGHAPCRDQYLLTPVSNLTLGIFVNLLGEQLYLRDTLCWRSFR